MCRPPHLRENPWLALDYRLGLRGAGLILYGALPASLGALGALKAPEQGALQFGRSGIIFIVLVALIPVSVTFLLTRQRLGSWYLLADDLNLRSLLITAEILVASTLVCIATRALSKPDIQQAVAEWWALPFWTHANAIGHAILLAVAYLVASSTLFLTVIKEDSGLPLLPKKDVLTNEIELRKQLAFTVAAAKDWPADAIDGKTLGQRTDELHTHIAEASDNHQPAAIGAQTRASGFLHGTL